MAGDGTSPAATSRSSASPGSAAPRRARTSRPKVKTGCNSCKQRRIKCDERRPSCTQCVRSKKHCTGYPPPPRAKIFEEMKIAPRPVAGANMTFIPLVTNTSQPLAARPPVTALQARPRPPARARRLTPPQTPTAAPSSPAVSLTVHRPSINLPFTPQEGQYFLLFREHTANELSGFFDSSFWSRSVLQECHSEEAIRHSVVALGALYKTMDKMSESPPSSPSNGLDLTDNAVRHWEFAFHHYSLALKAMHSPTPNDLASQRTILMAIVLLACFDSFMGDHKQAIRQIQNGLRMLEHLRAERRKMLMASPEEPVEEDLIQMFTRLAIQAKSYDMAFHFPQPYVIRLTQNNGPASAVSDGGSPVSTSNAPIPASFFSLLEARLAWDTLCEKVFRFTETMFQFTTDSPMGILPTALKAYGLGFGAQIRAWSDAFEVILNSRTSPEKSSQEKSAIAVLKMCQIMGQILFLMTFNNSETQFDDFLPDFKTIVSLATEVVGDDERHAAAKRCPDPQNCNHRSNHENAHGNEFNFRHIKPSFCADLGIVPPLFVVATKCRDALTRRRAIQLLQSSPRREGMWDSELVSRIGMWVTEIEEEEEKEVLHPAIRSPAKYLTRSPTSISRDYFDHGTNGRALGPGGNARWQGGRQGSVTSTFARDEQTSIPEEKRVMIRAVEFDLRERTATLRCGTRNLAPGMADTKTRETSLAW